MKVIPHAVFHEDDSLLVWRPRGAIDETEVKELTTHLGHLESRRLIPFNRFTDTQNADGIDLNLLYTFHVSLYHRSSGYGSLIKSAILTTGRMKERYKKLHALLTQGSPIDVRIFDKREDARNWLDAPFALLLPDDGLRLNIQTLNGSAVTIHQAA